MSNHPFRPLRRPEVRRLFTAAVVSNIGTWVQLIVVGSLVARDTGSAVQTGLVALATFMPQGFAAPFGGLLADRHDRRKVFALMLLLQALATGALAVTLGAGVRTPGVLIALIMLSASAGALGQPSYTAIQPDLVPPDELMAMVSLVAYSWNSGRVLGPLLGTVLVSALGPAWTITFNAVTFVLMAVVVMRLRHPLRAHGATDGTIGERLADGWRSLWACPGCAHTLVLAMGINILVIPFMGLIPIYAHSEFGGGTGLAGTIASAQGVGSLVGGMAVAVLGARLRRSTLLGGQLLLLSGCLALYGVAPSAGAVVVAATLLGAASSSTIISLISTLQRDAPAASRGRVLSIFQALAGTTYGLGLLLVGSVGDATDLRVSFVGGAAVSLALCVVLAARLPGWRRAIDGQSAGDELALATA